VTSTHVAATAATVAAARLGLRGPDGQRQTENQRACHQRFLHMVSQAEK
jgi:hypothetical protein